MATESPNEAAPPASGSQGEDAPNNDDNTRAESPPLPQRHTAATPGPRAARLQQVYAQSLQRTLAKLGWDTVAGCYPTVARRADGVLRQVQAQMVEKLAEKCEKEFESILVQRQVVPKLNELEGVIGDAAHRRTSSSDPDPTPPHLLPPDRILAAHLRPALTQHTSQLNARLQTTQAQNALLHDEVRRQRDEIEALLERLEGAAADVRGANEVMGDVVAQLAKEAMEGGRERAEA